ncbi:MAG: hypothetical protein AB7P76_12065 [Candidatus Melainabacteria bacterium]
MHILPPPVVHPAFGMAIQTLMKPNSDEPLNPKDTADQLQVRAAINRLNNGSLGLRVNPRNGKAYVVVADGSHQKAAEFFGWANGSWVSEEELAAVRARGDRMA